MGRIYDTPEADPWDGVDDSTTPGPDAESLRRAAQARVDEALAAGERPSVADKAFANARQLPGGGVVAVTGMRVVPLNLGLGGHGRKETLHRGRRMETLKALGITTTEQLRVKSGIDTVSLEASSANQLRMAIDQVYARLEQQGEADA